MNCWQTLGIDSSADKKTVKLAYAKLLKTTRPDDNPEGFIVLHQAYKTALLAFAQGRQRSPAVEPERPNPGSRGVTAPSATSAHLNTQSLNTQTSTNADLITTSTVPFTIDTPDDDELVDSDNDVLPTDISMADPDKNDDFYLQPDYRKILDEDKQLIKAHAYQLLGSPKRVNRIEEWKYIETVKSIIDLNFSVEVGDLLFTIISKANYSTLKDNKPFIKKPVLNYLNDYFQWDKNWKRYEKEHGRKQAHAIFAFTGATKHSAQNHEPYLARRLAAFSIDLAFAATFIVLSQMVPRADLVISVGVLYLIFGIPSLEVSPWQASIGKRMLGLEVVNKRGRRLGWYQSFCRNFVMILGLGLTQFSAIANLVVYSRYRALIHDKLTGSYVVKHRR